MEEFSRKLKKQLYSENVYNIRIVSTVTGGIIDDTIIDFIKESACRRGHRVGYDWFLKRNLTQQEIANYTGTSRQTVTEVFNELKKANQIYFNRNKILIRDSFNLVCDEVV